MAAIKVDDQSSTSDNLITPTAGNDVAMDTKEAVDASSSTPTSMDSMSSAPTTDNMLSGSTNISSPMGSVAQDPMMSGAMPDDDKMPEPETAGPTGDMNSMTSTAQEAKKQDNSQVKAFKPKTGMLNILRVVVALLLVAIIVVLYMQNKTLNNDKTNLTNQVSGLNQTISTDNSAANAQKATSAAVGKLVPSLVNETPVIVNLSSSLLSAEKGTTFSGAQSGDQLLIYVESEEAVLYRPSTGKVIAQWSVGYTSASTTTSSTSSTK